MPMRKPKTPAVMPPQNILTMSRSVSFPMPEKSWQNTTPEKAPMLIKPA